MSREKFISREKRIICRRHFTHAFLLPVCASYAFGENINKRLLTGGRIEGGGGGVKKNWIGWGFGQFLPMQ